MKWLKRMLIALAVLLVIAVALPFFISLDDYIPRIEKEVSARLKEPVSIKSIRFAALPLPHVTVDGITVGTTDDIRLGKVLVTPDLFSLLQSTKVIKSIEIDSLVLTQKAIDRIPAWTKSDAAKSPQPPPQVRVESIRLDNAVVRLRQGELRSVRCTRTASTARANPRTHRLPRRTASSRRSSSLTSRNI